MTKTLHVAFANAEGGIDPQASSDMTTSGAIIGAIFARPGPAGLTR